MEEKVEAIKASDLLKLMSVVEKAAGLWNCLEQDDSSHTTFWFNDWRELGDALRELGLTEVEA